MSKTVINNLIYINLNICSISEIWKFEQIDLNKLSSPVISKLPLSS